MTTDAPKLPMPPKTLKPPRDTEHAAGNMRDVTHEQSGKVSGSSVRSDRNKSKP
jgi:hypothetical protein